MRRTWLAEKFCGIRTQDTGQGQDKRKMTSTIWLMFTVGHTHWVGNTSGKYSYWAWRFNVRDITEARLGFFLRETVLPNYFLMIEIISWVMDVSD